MCHRLLSPLLAAPLLLLAAAQSEATAIFNFTGNSSAGVPVDFQADLTISGNTLTVVLTNNSTQSLNPNDVFTSFYFAIDGSPTLTWASGTGDVYLGDKNNPDGLVQANQDLTSGASRWDFRQGLTLQPGTTVLSYGLGAAGNNSLTPNGFDGSATDGVDLGIYAGDVTTSNLQLNLVKTTATFTFTGVSGYSEADISAEALFGLGTQPDSTGFVPEPGTAVLLGLGLTGLAAGRRRRAAR